MPVYFHTTLILQSPADLASRFPHVLSLAQRNRSDPFRPTRRWVRRAQQILIKTIYCRIG